MQIIRRTGAAPIQAGPRPPAFDYAKQAAIEKKITPYVKLTCQHYTTWDEIEIYSAFAPSRDKFWCEKCGKWVHRLTKRRNGVGQLPLF